MKKGIVIILAVAIIGTLGVYGKSHSSSGQNSSLGQASSAVQSDSTNSQNNADTSTSTTSANLNDGTYTGDSEDTPYGNVQIAVVVSGGKITDVNFLQMPQDLDHSQEVTAFAKPLLKQETVGKTNAQIQFVSGATQTSEAYEQSLQSALNQAA